VYGISSDSPEDNKAFATAQRLPFPLLTDPSSILRKVGEGVGGRGAGLGGGDGSRSGGGARAAGEAGAADSDGSPTVGCLSALAAPFWPVPWPLPRPLPLLPQTFGIPNDLLFLPGRQTFVFGPDGKVRGRAEPPRARRPAGRHR
jgi:hypothetical protein